MGSCLFPGHLSQSELGKTVPIPVGAGLPVLRPRPRDLLAGPARGGRGGRLAPDWTTRRRLCTVRGGGAGRHAGITWAVARWPSRERRGRSFSLGAPLTADLRPRIPTPSRRRYVRLRARLEPVLRGLRLPGLLSHRGDQVPKRPRPAPPPRRAHVLR